MKLRQRLTFLLFCCVMSCEHPKQAIKQIRTNQIKSDKLKTSFVLNWYIEPYLTRANAFVTFSDNGVTDTIVKIDDAKITDIQMNDDRILIKLYNTSLNAGYHNRTKIKGFKIMFQQATYKEWFMHYHVDEKFIP